MAIFMPHDSNLPHLNFNNILKFQTPTQIIQKLMHKHNSEESFLVNSQFYGSSNEPLRMMGEEKHHKSLSIHLDMNHADESCNSTDSDLSVGQEKIDDDKSDNNCDQTESEMAENQMPSNIGEEDNSSNTSSSRFTRLCSLQKPKEIAESSLMMHPNPSRFQEEIFRNSQLYAEELVRQQLAAAARLQSMSGSKIFPHIDPSAFEKQRMILNADEIDPSLSLTSKLNFQSGVFAPKTIDNNQNGNNLFCNNKSAINFQNIHSHLSAISQITNNLTSNIKKDDSTSLSSLSRESSQSPSNFQHLKQHHPSMIFHTHQNQLHERNLKFSIDNILKADFGRRITEPLLRSSKSRKALRDGKPDKDLFKKFNAPASMKESFGLRDDNPRVPEGSPPNQSPPSAEQGKSESNNGSKSSGTGSGTVWPAWVFCTRYSDRPSSGPRVKRPKKPPSDSSMKSGDDEKRPRTAFSGPQLARLKHEFNENRYLTEKRRQQLSAELGLNEAQIKIWFQNKRAKIKKSTGQKNPLALQLMAQGLYNHSTVPLSKEEEEMQELQAAN